MSPQVPKTTQGEMQVARPLKVLVPLIKQDLEDGDKASKAAGMPHYAAAGAKMIETGLKDTALYDWTERNFNLKKTQTILYIDYAELLVSGTPKSHKSFTSQRDFERRHLGRNRPTSGAVRRDWTTAVDDIAEKAKREAARIRDEHLSREKERQADFQLAMRLIDIGYKVLAKELHPDKGGSKDAMSRLSRVRDRLKSHA